MTLQLPVRPRRLVIKLGTGMLTSGPGRIDTDRLAAIAGEIHALREAGSEVIVVSSGAIGLGIGRLGLKRRPVQVAKLQSCAAIGQGILIQLWQEALAPFGHIVAQLLLTRDDLRSRHRHLAAKETLDCLLKQGVIPVINENDSVSSEEIKFGDNDILSAMVASLTGAELLFILSTAPGLIDREGTGEIIPVVPTITPAIEALAGGTDNPLAVGGMVTKIGAAKLAARSGCGTYLAHGGRPEVMTSALRGEGVGTFFAPHGIPLESKKRWLAFFEKARGGLRVDAGARRALTEKGASLLGPGIQAVEGDFARGEAVDLIGPEENSPFARGLARWSAAEMRAILEHPEKEAKRGKGAFVHRDSLALLG